MKRKTYKIPMDVKLYNRAYCKELAKEIIKAGHITGMSRNQMAREIYGHAYFHYNFDLIPGFLRKLKIFKTMRTSTVNGVDLADNGDRWYAKLAYVVFWFLPGKSPSP